MSEYKEQETKTILDVNGKEHVYSVSYLPAMSNYTLALKLCNVIGIPLTELAAWFANRVEFNYLGTAFSKILINLHKNDNNGQFVLELLSQTKRNDIPITRDTFNTNYTGNMCEFIDALKFTLEIHIARFLRQGSFG